MARELGLDEVLDHFTLVGDEVGQLRNKAGATRLGRLDSCTRPPHPPAIAFTVTWSAPRASPRPRWKRSATPGTTRRTATLSP